MIAANKAQETNLRVVKDLTITKRFYKSKGANFGKEVCAFVIKGPG